MPPRDCGAVVMKLPSYERLASMACYAFVGCRITDCCRNPKTLICGISRFFTRGAINRPEMLEQSEGIPAGCSPAVTRDPKSLNHLSGAESNPAGGATAASGNPKSGHRCREFVGFTADFKPADSCGAHL